MQGYLRVLFIDNHYNAFLTVMSTYDKNKLKFRQSHFSLNVMLFMQIED